MTQKNLFVVAVVESGVVTSVYAPDGTPVDYDIIDHDEIAQADEARLRGALETLTYIARVERLAGRPVSVQETVDRVRARLPEDAAADTERRADRGRELLGRYMAVTGTDEDMALGDLLADLRHMADRDNYDYGLADERAESHYADETAQQAAGSWSAQVREAEGDLLHSLKKDASRT